MRYDPPPTDSHEPAPPAARRVVAERGPASNLERWVLPDRMYERLDHGTLTEERPFTPPEHTWADDIARTEAARESAAARAEAIQRACEQSAVYLARVEEDEVTAEDDRDQIVCLTQLLEVMAS